MVSKKKAQGAIGNFYAFQQKFYQKSHAQGTIEYLVIIGVIVVIALVVVSMLAGFADSGTSVVTTTQRAELLTGPIAVTDTIVTPDGNFLLEMRSNQTGHLNIEKISADNNTQVYYSNNDLPAGSTKYFPVYTNQNCEPGTNITTNITITYTTRYGITQTQRYENVIIPCQQATISSNSSMAETEGPDYSCGDYALAECWHITSNGNTGLFWGPVDEETGAISLDDGKFNSDLVLSYYSTGDNYPAFEYCKNIDDGIHPKGTWYLPARDELSAGLTEQFINGVPLGFQENILYRSSTEGVIDIAFIIYYSTEMSEVLFNYDPKNVTYPRVPCFR
ncbi:MAG: hypothetical protein ACMXYK_05735 [Candidatus Woesearchaeota archaeon]